MNELSPKRLESKFGYELHREKNTKALSLRKWSMIAATPLCYLTEHINMVLI